MAGEIELDILDSEPDWGPFAAPTAREGNGGSAVSSRYQAPFAFTGGTIAQVTVDLSGRPYRDVEKELALAFSRD